MKYFNLELNVFYWNIPAPAFNNARFGIKIKQPRTHHLFETVYNILYEKIKVTDAFFWGKHFDIF